MTILGPLPCASCKAPVTVERRPVVIEGHAQVCRCPHRSRGCIRVESTELVQVVVTDRSGDHICERA